MWKCILILITVLTLNNSCRKDNNNNDNNLPAGCYYKTFPYIPSDFVSYFGSYKTGSWWVYTDSTGKYRDSSYVSGYSRSGGGKQTICDTGIVGAQLDLEDAIFLNIQSTLFGKVEYVVTCKGNDSASNFIIEENGGQFTIYDNNGLYSGDNNTHCSILASYIVSGVTYKNVLLCEAGYFAPGIGIIQTGYDNTYGYWAMHLIKYHIAQ